MIMNAKASSPRHNGEFHLTGRHVLAILIAFFGVIFAANGVMIHYALATFSGTESDTPYKDGLAYNTELEAARRQDALNWTVDAHLVRTNDGGAQVEVQGKSAGQAIAGVTGHVRLERPADKREDRAGELVAVGGGRWQAELEGIAPGQWDLVVTLERGEDRVFMSRNRVQLR